MDKYQRYKQKCVSEGRCPHCGKPCAPYYECDERRAYKKSDRALQSLVNLGIVTKTRQSNGQNTYRGVASPPKLIGRQRGYVIKSIDCRHLPRIRKKYFNVKNLIMDELGQSALTEKEIVKLVWDKITTIKTMHRRDTTE